MRTSKADDEIKKELECCANSDGTCEQCPYVDGECRAFEQLASDALALIKRLEAEKADLLEQVEKLKQERNEVAVMPRWISVEKRLPEDEKDVAVIVKLPKGNWMHLTAFRMPYGGWWINRGSGLDYAEITHWAPLPEPMNPEK